MRSAVGPYRKYIKHAHDIGSEDTVAGPNHGFRRPFCLAGRAGPPQYIAALPVPLMIEAAILFMHSEQIASQSYSGLEYRQLRIEEAHYMERDGCFLFTAPVTARWQITIPEHVREQLQLIPGQELAFFQERDGRIYIYNGSAQGLRNFERLMNEVTKLMFEQDEPKAAAECGGQLALPSDPLLESSKERQDAQGTSDS